MGLNLPRETAKFGRPARRQHHQYDSDKFTKLTQTKKSCFSVLSTNIQSINSKFNELEAFIEKVK